MNVRRKASAIVPVVIGSLLVAILVVALPSLNAWPLIWLGGAAAVTPFAVAAVRGRIDLFEPIYLFASTYAVLFVVRPAVDLLTPGGIPVIEGQAPGPTYQLALLISLLGLLSFYLGYYVKVGVGVGRAVPLPEAQLTPRMLRWSLLLILAAAAAAYSLFLINNGGLGALSTLLAGRSVSQRSIIAGSSGYLYSAPLWVTGPAILLLATTPRWLSARGLAVLAVLAISELVNAAEGTRSWFLLVAAMVVVLWYLRHRRRPSVKAVVAGVVLAFLVGVVAPAQYRNVQSRSGSFADAVSAAFTNPGDAVTSFFQNGDTQIIDDFAIEIRFVPSVVPYAFGQTYLDDLSAPAPRTLWPGKPIDGDSQMMADVWPSLAANHTGFSWSMFGEPYLNFGVVGVVVFSMLMGIAWRALYEWFRRAPSKPAVIAVFAISWPFLLLYLHGGVGVSYPRQAIALVPAALIIFVAEVRGRRRVHHLSGAPRSEIAQ